MLIEQNISSITKKFWRLVEVYLFLIFSVSGGHGFIKSSTFAKNYSKNDPVRILVSKQSPKALSFSFYEQFLEVSHKTHKNVSVKKSAFNSSHILHAKPLFSKFIVQRSVLLPSDCNNHAAFNLSQISAPLLI